CAPRIEQQKAERMASEAVIAQVSLEVRLLHVNLVMNGDGPILRRCAGGGFTEPRVISLAAPHDGIDERRGSRAEIERGERGAIGGLQKRLIFGGREKEFRSTIGVVIEHFDARESASWRELVGQGFRANKPTPQLCAEM